MVAPEELRRIIETDARRIEELRAEVLRRAGQRDSSAITRDAWQKACQAFHDEFLLRSFPGGYDAIASIREGDGTAIETALQFLEVDPWFFRSGYIKADVARALANAPLDEEQKARVRNVVLRKVSGHPVREFRRYCHLAASVADAPFVRQVEALAALPEAATARQARWVLLAVERVGMGRRPVR